ASVSPLKRRPRSSMSTWRRRPRPLSTSYSVGTTRLWIVEGVGRLRMSGSCRVADTRTPPDKESRGVHGGGCSVGEDRLFGDFPVEHPEDADARVVRGDLVELRANEVLG